MFWNFLTIILAAVANAQQMRSPALSPPMPMPPCEPCGKQWGPCCPAHDASKKCLSLKDSCQAEQCVPCAAWLWGPCCIETKVLNKTLIGKHTWDETVQLVKSCPQFIKGVEVACALDRCEPCGDLWQTPCNGEHKCKKHLVIAADGKCSMPIAVPGPANKPPPPALCWPPASPPHMPQAAPSPPHMPPAPMRNRTGRKFM